MSTKKTKDNEINDDATQSLLLAERNAKAYSSEGDDDLSGDDQNDKLDGADGDDHLQGGQGSDDLKGGSGDDDLSGDDGNDKLNGDDGDDFISGGLGEDNLSGGTGNDDLSGDDGNDKLNGDDGDDLIDGGMGKDTLTGGNGDDELSGDDGNDSLLGGIGDDYLDGGFGNDTLSGGLGDDTYQIDSSRDKINESANSGTDTVISSVSYELGKNLENLTLTGTAFSAEGNKLANTLIGNDVANLLEGGEGHDVLTGNGGADSFVFSAKGKAASSDVITDFTQGQDTLLVEAKGLKGELSANQFKSTTSGAVLALDADDRFVFQTDTGNLYYDRDGSGSSEMVLLVTLTGVSTLTSADIDII